MKQGVGIAIGLVVAIAAVGCSTGSGGSARPQPTVTVSASDSFAPLASETPTPSPRSGASNLFLTQPLRQALIHAKAQEVHVSDSAFVSLYKGSAFYAIDHDTGTYWAGASVVPSRHSIRAQVSSQDEGGYNIFELKPGGTWQIFDTGLDGPQAREGGQCPVKIPSDVLAVWHWAPKTCDPPTGN
ncbi:MAG TPA: hypothetical protein VHC43_05580 [Mycobacteriales bacterium]|nr:hypothetical protein [Mycobacteriales bacterium]